MPPPDPAAVDAAIARSRVYDASKHDATVLADAVEHYRQQLAAATARAEVERKELLDRIQLLTHQIITCGVAASHPDAGLASRGVYGNKWDSQQAGEVRALRKRCDDATERAERMREALAKVIAHTGFHQPAKNDLLIGLLVSVERIARAALFVNQEGNADG